MNLKEFAESRNLPQSKVKQICKEVLQKIPATFTPEEIKQLDEALGGATTNFLSTTQAYLEGDNGQVQDSISLLSPQDLDKAQMAQRVKEIVGEDLMKKNIILYLSFLKQSLEQDKYRLEVAVFQIEQGYYDKLRNYQHSLYEDGKARVGKARTSVLSLFSADGLKEELEANSDPEMNDLITEALSFIESIG